MPTALSTDLYEITMAAGYYAFGEIGQGSFELSVRHLRRDRGYLIAAGLDQALEYLERLHFEPDEIEFLRDLPALASVPPSFFDKYLPDFAVTVWRLQACRDGARRPERSDCQAESPEADATGSKTGLASWVRRRCCPRRSVSGRRDGTWRRPSDAGACHAARPPGEIEPASVCDSGTARGATAATPGRRTAAG